MSEFILDNRRGVGTQRGHARGGISLIELVVSAVLLVALMSFITTLSYRVHLVWKDVNQQRVAVHELSNQLETLTNLSIEQAIDAIDSLTVSELCRQTLKDPQLNGEVIADAMGSRLVLRLNWKRRNVRQPIELAGWIVNHDEDEKRMPIP